MTDELKTEFHVRHSNKLKGSAGIFASPFSHLNGAVNAFVRNHDSKSAIELKISDSEELVSIKDVTDQVVAELCRRISNNFYQKCPHPFVRQEFDDWEVLQQNIWEILQKDMENSDDDELMQSPEMPS